MSDEYIAQWIEKAENDLKVAEHESNLPEGEAITDAICFHCQQAVEKLLKGFLASRNIDFGKTHNLEFLLEECIKVDSEFNEVDVGNLTFYAVEIRYPDEFYTPAFEEAADCFRIASEVKTFVLKKIGSTKS